MGSDTATTEESDETETPDETLNQDPPPPPQGPGETTGGSKSQESRGKRWSVRGLDEGIITEDNVNAILEGDYEEADPEVKKLFLFIYCDCALLMMPKVPREDAGVAIRVQDYFKQFPEITSAMIRVLVLMDAKTRKKKAEEDEERRARGQENQRQGRVVNVPREDPEQKKKGGRPKDSLNFDNKMQGTWRNYTRAEVQNRKEKEDSDPMTWYKAAVTEMDAKTAGTSNDVASKQTTPRQPETLTDGQVQTQDDDLLEEFVKRVEV